MRFDSQPAHVAAHRRVVRRMHHFRLWYRYSKRLSEWSKIIIALALLVGLSSVLLFFGEGNAMVMVADICVLPTWALLFAFLVGQRWWVSPL